jgi:hypothetical protein
MDDHTDTDERGPTRRQALTALGAGAGMLAGIGAFTGSVAAWDRFDVCFDGCSEVSMIVSESDIDLGGSQKPPAVAKVIVSTGSGLECRPIEFTAENATTMPAQFGDFPVVKYTVPAGEKIVGVLEYNYSSDPNARFDDPVWCVNANRNACATECNGDGNVELLYDLSDAACVSANYSVCPPSTICPDSDGGTDDCGDTGTGDIEVTWVDCETVTVTGSDDGLDEIIVHPLRCFPNGPCPDGVPGGRTIEDPELPLTIDDRYLAVDNVPYTIAWIELIGDVEQDYFEKPADLNCDFIDISWADCETVSLRGPDENLDKIEVYLQRCFEDPGLGCPDGHIVTFENPTLPLTLGRDDLATGDEEYRIDAVDLFGDVRPTDATPPDYFDCSFETDTGDIEVSWEDCETVTVTGSDDGLDEIIVHAMRCFPNNGPCPDGGMSTIDNPELPLTIDDQYLTVDNVPYTIEWLEIKDDIFGKPADLECPLIDVYWKDCETVSLQGPDENLDKIEVSLQRCFEDPGLGCPDGQILTFENPTLPLTLGRDDLATGDEEYRIDAVDLFGDVRPADATPPGHLDCSFETE